MNYTTRPPETLSGLIRLAVGNARRLNHDLYTPLYSKWHAPEEARGQQVCCVCLAGAVIAGTLGAPAHRDVVAKAIKRRDAAGYGFLRADRA